MVIRTLLFTIAVCAASATSTSSVDGRTNGTSQYPKDSSPIVLESASLDRSTVEAALGLLVRETPPVRLDNEFSYFNHDDDVDSSMMGGFSIDTPKTITKEEIEKAQQQLGVRAQIHQQNIASELDAVMLRDARLGVTRVPALLLEMLRDAGGVRGLTNKEPYQRSTVNPLAEADYRIPELFKFSRAGNSIDEQLFASSATEYLDNIEKTASFHREKTPERQSIVDQIRSRNFAENLASLPTIPDYILRRFALPVADQLPLMDNNRRLVYTNRGSYMTTPEADPQAYNPDVSYTRERRPGLGEVSGFLTRMTETDRPSMAQVMVNAFNDGAWYGAQSLGRGVLNVADAMDTYGAFRQSPSYYQTMMSGAAESRNHEDFRSGFGGNYGPHQFLSLTPLQQLQLVTRMNETAGSLFRCTRDPMRCAVRFTTVPYDNIWVRRAQRVAHRTLSAKLAAPLSILEWLMDSPVGLPVRNLSQLRDINWEDFPPMCDRIGMGMSISYQRLIDEANPGMQFDSVPSKVLTPLCTLSLFIDKNNIFNVKLLRHIAQYAETTGPIGIDGARNSNSNRTSPNARGQSMGLITPVSFNNRFTIADFLSNTDHAPYQQESNDQLDAGDVSPQSDASSNGEPVLEGAQYAEMKQFLNPVRGFEMIRQNIYQRLIDTFGGSSLLREIDLNGSQLFWTDEEELSLLDVVKASIRRYDGPLRVMRRVPDPTGIIDYVFNVFENPLDGYHLKLYNNTAGPQFDLFAIRAELKKYEEHPAYERLAHAYHLLCEATMSPVHLYKRYISAASSNEIISTYSKLIFEPIDISGNVLKTTYAMDLKKLAITHPSVARKRVEAKKRLEEELRGSNSQAERTNEYKVANAANVDDALKDENDTSGYGLQGLGRFFSSLFQTNEVPPRRLSNVEEELYGAQLSRITNATSGNRVNPLQSLNEFAHAFSNQYGIHPTRHGFYPLRAVGQGAASLVGVNEQMVQSVRRNTENLVNNVRSSATNFTNNFTNNVNNLAESIPNVSNILGGFQRDPANNVRLPNPLATLFGNQATDAENRGSSSALGEYIPFADYFVNDSYLRPVRNVVNEMTTLFNATQWFSPTDSATNPFETNIEPLIPTHEYWPLSLNPSTTVWIALSQVLKSEIHRYCQQGLATKRMLRQLPARRTLPEHPRAQVTGFAETIELARECVSSQDTMSYVFRKLLLTDSDHRPSVDSISVSYALTTALLADQLGHSEVASWGSDLGPALSKPETQFAVPPAISNLSSALSDIYTQTQDLPVGRTPFGKLADLIAQVHYLQKSPSMASMVRAKQKRGELTKLDPSVFEDLQSMNAKE